MAKKRVYINDQLRNNIIETRKNLGYTAAELSEKSGHSKFWLSNIEGKKTVQIKKDDIFALYRILLPDKNISEITKFVETLINQPLNSWNNWDSLISIEEEYANIDDISILNSEISNSICKISNSITNFSMYASVHKKQAILTALLHFQRSLYFNPELAYTLLYIPVYGVSPIHRSDVSNSVDELLALAARYQDLVLQNDSIKLIKRCKEMDEEQDEVNYEAGLQLLLTLKNILKLIADYETINTSQLQNLESIFNSSVSILLKRITLHVPEEELFTLFPVHNGNDFCRLIDGCITFMKKFQDELNLPDVMKYITQHLYDEAITKLKNVQ